MYVVELAIRQSEQMESDHRHAGYNHHILYAEDTYEKRKLNVLDISNSFMIHIIILNRNIRNIRNKL